MLAENGINLPVAVGLIRWPVSGVKYSHVLQRCAHISKTFSPGFRFGDHNNKSD